MSERLFLIDAMALIYRAYFAMISTPMVVKGKSTAAVYGFVNSLIKILQDEKPDHIAVCFDTEKPTFRHKEYPKYKAQREEIPTDMPYQIFKVKEIIKALRIPSVELDGYEADDIIGTLVKQAEKEDVLSFMVTADKDYMQLVSDKTFLYKPIRNIYGNKTADVEIIDSKAVENKFGVGPDKVIEILGLMGDASDNIPGVKGIGEKTAMSLIKEFGTIDNIYASIKKITKEKLKENLLTYKNDAYLAKKLVTIKTDVPLDINFHHLIKKEPDNESLLKLFEELEFRAFIKKLGLSELKPSVKKSDEMEISIKGEKVGDITVNIPEEIKTLQNIKTIKHKYYTIKNEDEFTRLVKKLSGQELISFDTETTSLEPITTNIVGMSFSYQEAMGFYVPILQESSDTNLFEVKQAESISGKPGINLNFAIENIRPVLENKKIRKVGQNLKFDYLVMRAKGIEMDNLFFDTQIAGYILDPEGRHNMDALSEKYLNYTPIHIEELIGKGKDQITMDKVVLPVISEYASEDADITLQLFHKLKYELTKINLYKLCSDLEFPLVKVLAEMEYEGILVDKRILKELDSSLLELIKKCEQKIYDYAGKIFKINSPKELRVVLFDELGLKPTKTTKTGHSTDSSVLESLKFKHPIIDILLDYRMMTKLQSTYTSGLLDAINPKTGRVHTSYMQIIAATGRLSSVNPNLQNIPIRTEAGRSIRKAFVAKSNDYEIMSADYSQIELRIMAHYCEGENMITAFKRNHDIHMETAMKVFDIKSKKDVTPGMRRKAKEVNFGIIYGIGAFGLANRLDMKNSEAKDLIDKYFGQYPNVKIYMERTKKFARDNGYVETLMGRRRYLRQINNQNAAARAEDERAAINMPIQGTAADMIKIAMINIYEDFKEKKLSSKMLLQVHDELVFEVKKDEKEEVEKIVTRNMRNAIKLKVPVEVEIGCGKSWYEAH
jgi:DNA polymerase-1